MLNYVLRGGLEMHHILDRDRYTCRHCKTVYPKNELQVDFIIPVRDGTVYDENNLGVSCHKCNIEWAMKKG